MESSSYHSEQPDTSISTDIREVLFGDVPLEKIADYAQGLTKDNPWAYFAEAAQHKANGDTAAVDLALQKVLQMRSLEVSLYLQAWECLRSMGKYPSDDQAREIQGTIIEVALERGLDIVAAYADGSARYINYSGAAIVWDIHDADIDRMVGELLAVGQSIVDLTDVWDGPRPPAPPTGIVRISMLTFGGLHLVQGSYPTVSQDGLGGLALRSAFDLMQALVAKVKVKNS